MTSPDADSAGSVATAAVTLPPAGLLRRLAAMVYDGLLVLAVLMIVTACFLPLTGGEAVTWQSSPLLAVPYWAALVAAVVAYFGLPWTQRGQTLGMASWRLRVQRDDGFLLTWRDVAVRLGGSLLSWLPAGLGWVWALFDREHRTWHDSLSHSRVVVLPKGRKSGK
ncbi:MAG: RDD family protein, partial [Steroidobacteraceae bacterium]